MAVDRYAVFGHPISHSKSPLIHALFAKQTGQKIAYTAQDVPPGCLEVAVRVFHAGGGRGLNLTLPLKELGYQLVQELTPRAQLAGSVNTIFWQDETLCGDNTDGVGLIRDLTANLGLTLTGKRILILGAGGAARGIVGPLLEQKPAFLVIANRTLARAQELGERFAVLGKISVTSFADLAGKHFDLILNATSASLHGELPPLPEGLIAKGGCCYDLMYADRPTAFVRWGLEHGAIISADGLGMLVEQAAEAFYIWRGVRPETAPVIWQLRADADKKTV
ncbi:MAG: shikimate dehydrogenase [Methylohalobius sp.]|nr:shikimate dehydrogenase [Methylohalobius sp.]